MAIPNSIRLQKPLVVVQCHRAASERWGGSRAKAKEKSRCALTAAAKPLIRSCHGHVPSRQVSVLFNKYFAIPLRRPFRYPQAMKAVATLLFLGLTSCGGTMLVTPGNYDTWTCGQINNQINGYVARQKVLADLIRRAGPDLEGRVASAMAYNAEYAQTRDLLEALRAEAAEKKCPPPPIPASAEISGQVAPKTSQ